MFMRRLFVSILLTSLAAATHAAGQVQNRPTDAPIVTADSESWFVNGEPIQFAGDLYYPAGASVFFNGNTMVRSGHYNGVPLYTDTTLEPFSIVYVPLERGIMQPYERLRQRDVAGTTASRTPSFPVRVTASSGALPQAAAAPTSPPVPIGAIGVYSPEPYAAASPPTATPTVGTAGVTTSAPRATDAAFTSIGRPTSNDGVWIQYLGEKWVSAGAAVPATADRFRVVGQYQGFPVLARRDTSEQVIYIPTRDGKAAPYRLKQ